MKHSKGTIQFALITKYKNFFAETKRKTRSPKASTLPKPPLEWIFQAK